MEKKIKVNLRSLNLREDIFHSRYESSAMGFSNLNEAKDNKYCTGQIQKQTAYRSHYNSPTYNAKQYRTETNWNKYSTVTGETRISKRQRANASALEPNHLGSETLNGNKIFFWDQSRLGATKRTDESSQLKSYHGRKRRNDGLRVYYSIDANIKNKKNSVPIFNESPRQISKKMEKLQTKPMPTGEKHDDNPDENTSKSAKRTNRVIYTKKGQNKGQNDEEFTFQKVLDDEVNHGAETLFDMNNSDSGKLETAKFMTHGPHDFPKHKNDYLIRVDANMKDQKKEIAQPIKKRSTRKWIDLKENKQNNKEKPYGGNQKAKKESESTNLISFASHEQRKDFELQKMIAGGSSSIDSEEEQIATQKVSSPVNIFDQDCIKINNQLIQQSPRMEQNLQIKKMQMNKFVHQKQTYSPRATKTGEEDQLKEKEDTNYCLSPSSPSRLLIKDGNGQGQTQSTDFGKSTNPNANKRRGKFISNNNINTVELKSDLKIISEVEQNPDKNQPLQMAENITKENLNQLQQLFQLQKDHLLLKSLEVSNSNASAEYKKKIAQIRESEQNTSYNKSENDEYGKISLNSIAGIITVRDREQKTSRNQQKQTTLTPFTLNSSNKNKLLKKNDEARLRLGEERLKVYSYDTLDISASPTIQRDEVLHNVFVDTREKHIQDLNQVITPIILQDSLERLPSPPKLQVDQIISQKKKRSPRLRQIDEPNQIVNTSIFFMQQQLQLTKLLQVREQEKQKMQKQMERERAEQIKELERRKKIRQTKKVAGIKQLGKSLNSKNVKLQIDRALQQMSKSVENEGIFGRRIQYPSQIENYVGTLDDNRRQSTIEARISSVGRSRKGDRYSSRDDSARTQFSDEGKNQKIIRSITREQFKTITTPQLGRRRHNDKCKCILKEDRILQSNQHSPEQYRGISRERYSHGSRRTKTLDLKLNIFQNQLNPPMNSEFQTPLLINSNLVQSPQAQQQMEQQSPAFTLNRQQQQNETAKQEDSNNPNVEGQQYEKHSSLQKIIAEEQVIQENLHGIDPRVYPNQNFQQESLEATEIAAIKSQEEEKVSVYSPGGINNGESQLLSLQSILQIQQQKYSNKQFDENQTAQTQQNMKQMNGNQKKHLLEQPEILSIYSNWKEPNHVVPQNCVTLMENKEQVRNYSLLENNLNNSLVQTLKQELCKTKLNQEQNIKQYIEGVSLMAQKLNEEDINENALRQPAHLVDASIKCSRTPKLKDMKGLKDTQVMRYLNRSIIDTDRAHLLETSQFAPGQSLHIKNQFMSKQTRLRRNNLNRSLNVPNIRNDIQGRLSKVTNEELIKQQMKILPNFGLFHTRASSARRSMTSAEQEQHKMGSGNGQVPGDIGVSIYTSLDSTQRNFGGTQADFNRSRKKKMPFDVSSKHHVIESILQKIRGLQESGQQIRNDYLSKQMRPQSENQEQHDVDHQGAEYVETDQDPEDIAQRTLGQSTRNGDGAGQELQNSMQEIRKSQKQANEIQKFQTSVLNDHLFEKGEEGASPDFSRDQNQRKEQISLDLQTKLSQGQTQSQYGTFNRMPSQYSSEIVEAEEARNQLAETLAIDSSPEVRRQSSGLNSDLHHLKTQDKADQEWTLKKESRNVLSKYATITEQESDVVVMEVDGAELTKAPGAEDMAAAHDKEMMETPVIKQDVYLPSRFKTQGQLLEERPESLSLIKEKFDPESIELINKYFKYKKFNELQESLVSFNQQMLKNDKVVKRDNKYEQFIKEWSNLNLTKEQRQQLPGIQKEPSILYKSSYRQPQFQNETVKAVSSRKSEDAEVEAINRQGRASVAMQTSKWQSQFKYPKILNNRSSQNDSGVVESSGSFRQFCKNMDQIIVGQQSIQSSSNDISFSQQFRNIQVYQPGIGSLKHGDSRRLDSREIQNIVENHTDRRAEAKPPMVTTKTRSQATQSFDVEITTRARKAFRPENISSGLPSIMIMTPFGEDLAQPYYNHRRAASQISQILQNQFEKNRMLRKQQQTEASNCGQLSTRGQQNEKLDKRKKMVNFDMKQEESPLKRSYEEWVEREQIGKPLPNWRETCKV